MRNLDLVSYFQRYRDDLPHHRAAVIMLQDELLRFGLMDEDAEWIDCFEAEPPDKIKE